MPSTLAETIQGLLELVETGDVCGLFLLIAFFAFVGHLAVQSRPKLHAWGLRFAFLAFVAYVLFAVARDGLSDAAVLAADAFRATLAAGLVLGVAWCGLAFVHVIHQAIFAPILSRVRHAKRQFRVRHQTRKDQNEYAAEFERNQQERERSAAERERARREAEQRETDARHRSALARSECELHYLLHAPDIAERFSRDDFEAYLAKYMGPEHPSEQIQQHALRLKALIDRHAARVNPPQKLKSFEELAAWYQDQQARIEALPIVDKVKRRLLVQLNTRHAELTDDFLERMEP